MRARLRPHLPTISKVPGEQLGDQGPGDGPLVIRDGKIEEQAQRGLRRSDASDRVRPSDVWHIGSDGKAMTATLIVRLVDRGVLAWTTPLEQMLPGLAGEMRPEYRTMTLVELLSHRAGLPHDVVDLAQIARIGAEHRPSSAERLEYVALALEDCPVNTPGTAYSYSNTGYLIAAVVAERATGESYEALMREQIFGPLRMASVGFGAPPVGEPQGHFDGRPTTSANPEFIAPAGNMYLSLRDWAKFCIDQMEGANGRGTLLKPETYRLMQTPQPDSNYGFGWQALPKALDAQGPVLTHRGSDGTLVGADGALSSDKIGRNIGRQRRSIHGR